jgi:3-isopropylmalate/(R)-2-methylmalate dehydratase small subunit
MAINASVEKVSGRAVPVRGDDIDTDRITPARFLRCVTFEGIERHAFEDDRRAARGAHPFDQPAFQGASILVVNRNFGCGSSREHAPQSLLRWGIRGVVGVSFAEIFFGNCVALGIPCVTLAPEEVVVLQGIIEKSPELEVTVDLRSRKVTAGDKLFGAGVPAGVRESFLSGSWDATSELIARPEEIAAVAASLPYVSGFQSGVSGCASGPRGTG